MKRSFPSIRSCFRMSSLASAVAVLLATTHCSSENDATTTGAGGGSGGDEAGGAGGMSAAGGMAGAGGEGGMMQPLPGEATVGIFAGNTSYFELDSGSSPLSFHFGSAFRWGAPISAAAGDFDGDGFDTVAVADVGSATFRLANENDSDELAETYQQITITDLPLELTNVGEGQAAIGLAGDWDGDGQDGVGFAAFRANAYTFYLRQSATTGPVDREITLLTADGFPASGIPVTGDFDGDGVHELGVVGGGMAYLTASIDETTPAHVFAVAGNRATVGDFDDDGIDTVAGFDTATNLFTITEDNTGAVMEEITFGHAEPGFWSWQPLAGRWQIPADPVAQQGYAWTEATPESKGFDPTQLATALDEGASVANVQSVVIIRDDALVAERYYHGYARHIAGNIKSVSKSVLSALFGIAIDQGVLGGLQDTVASHLPGYFQDLSAEKQAIDLEDIMTMRGGLAWNENAGSVGGLITSSDYVDFVVSQPLVSAPGATYNYSTGLTHLGSALLTEAAGESTRAFARTNLFEPLGISAPRWGLGSEGNFVGGAEMWLRPRDIARFGQLFLHGGHMNGQQVVSQAWVDASADPYVPEAGGRLYGLWWRERPWTNYESADSYFGWGYGGQFLFLFPSKDLIVVVTSKWSVTPQVSGQSATAIFNFVDNQILTALTD